MKLESESSKSKGHTRVQWAVTLLVDTIGLTYGLQCGWISPVTKILQSEESPVGRPLTDSELSLLAGLPSLFAIIGIIFSVNIVDTYGRKKLLLLITVVQLLCWILIISPANFQTLAVARSFCGLGAGGCFHVLPMYIKEISQDNIRGTLGSMLTLSQNLGILLMYIIGSYLDYYSVLYLVTCLPVLTLTALYVAPESPFFLVRKEKSEEAAATIAFLRGLDVNDKDVQAEIDSIHREEDYFKTIPKVSYLTILKDNAWCRGFIIMVLIFSMHGLNGSMSIVNYASILLADSKMTISPELQSLSIPIFLTLGTAVTICIADRMGRKVLLGMGFTLSALGSAGLASIILLRGYGWATPEWLPIIIILITVFFYGVGVSPIPYVIMTEMFNFQIRAKVMACLCTLVWLTSFVQLVSFTAISTAFGAYTSFYIFGIVNLVGLTVVVVLLPETAGKSDDQILAKLREKKI